MQDPAYEELAQEAAALRQDLNAKDYELYQKDRTVRTQNVETSAALQTYSEQLEGDKMQWVRKLNSVLLEKDRLNKEKAELAALLHEERLKNDDLELKLKSSSKKKAGDRVIHSELKSEKDENSRLRDLVHRLEVERAELRAKLRDHEGAAVNLTREHSELVLKLQQEQDRVALMESDTKSLIEQIRSLKMQIADYESEHAALVHERANMRESLAQLEGDKAESLSKVSDLNARHENFVFAMNNEKENLQWIHRRHTRLLASRSIALELHKVTVRREHSAFVYIQGFVHFLQSRAGLTAKLMGVLHRYSVSATKRSLDKWRSALDWRGTEKVQQAFVQLHERKGALAKCFADWRSAFLYQTRVKRNHRSALERVFRFYSDGLRGTLRRRFSKWRGKNHFHNQRSNRFQSMLVRGYNGKVRHSLQVWRDYMAGMRKEQAKEDVATEMSSLLLSQAVLSSWKTVVFRRKAQHIYTSAQEQAAEKLHNVTVLHGLQRYISLKKRKTDALHRALGRFTSHQLSLGFSQWKKELKEHKTLEKMALVFGRQHYKRYFVTFEKTFYAWKTHFLAHKHTTAAAQLATELPIKQDLEAQLHQVNTEFARTRQAKAMRAIFRWKNQELFSYFRRWKKTVPMFKSQFQRMVAILSQWQTLQTHRAISKWRHIQSQADLANLYERNQNLQGDNTALVEHINNLEQVLKHKEDQVTGMANNRLKWVANLFSRFGLKSAIRRWARHGLSLADKHSSGVALERTMQRRLLFDGFSTVRQFAVHRKKSDNRKSRLKHYFLGKWRGAMAESFNAWVHMHTILQRVKSAIKRMTTRRDQFHTQQGLNRWRDAVAYINIEEHRDHSHQTHLHNESLGKHIEDLAGQLQAETAHRTQLERALKKNSRARLANAVNRALTMSLYKGFKKWSDLAELTRKRMGKTRLMGFVYDKMKLRRAVRLWQRGANEVKTTELLVKVSAGQRETKELKRVMKGNQEQLESVLADKEQEIQGNEEVISTLNNRLQFLLNRTVQHQEEEYSMSKAGYMFKFWSNRYRVLKASLTKLTRVAHRSVLKNGLWDLKMNGLEVRQSQLERKVINLWMQGGSTRLLRSAIDLWRKNGHGKFARQLSSLYQNESQKNSTLQANIKALKHKATMKILQNTEKYFSLQVVREWGRVVRILRSIRIAGESFGRVSRGMKLQLALVALKVRRVQQRMKKRKVGKAFGRFLGNLQQKAFSAFAINAKDCKLLRKLFLRLDRQYIREKLLFALGRIQETASVAQTNAWNLSQSRLKTVTRMFSSLYHWREAKAFRVWKESGVQKHMEKRNLRKAMLAGVHRKFESAVKLWKEAMDYHRLDQYYNSEGPLAIENSLLKERITIYSKLVEEEGLNPKQVERYILERESMAGALRRKGIARMQYAAGLNAKMAEDLNQVLPRALLRWQVWTVKRQKARRLARRMLAYRKAGDMLKAFFTWKRGPTLVRNSLANYSRDQMLGLIAKMDHDIKTLEAMIETQNGKLRFMTAYGSLLEQHTHRGRNQSLTVLAMHVLNPLGKAMSRWSAYTHAVKTSELKSGLVDLDDEYHVLQLRYEELERDYKLVFTENSELKQRTMEGLEIASAIEALSREREKLSVDLADRAVTIKRLLEENGDLASRLRSARKEAETLRVLTTPAERESRYDTQRRM